MSAVVLLVITLLLSTWWPFGAGRESFGFSGLLTDTIVLGANGSTGWMPVKGWSAPQSLGFYSHGMTIGENGSFQTLSEGTYFISCTLLVEYELPKETTVCVQEVDTGTCTVCLIKESLQESVTKASHILTCFPRLKAQTKHAVYIKSYSAEVRISKGSSLAIHFIGPTAVLSALSLPVTAAEIVGQNESKREFWLDVDSRKQAEFGYYRTFADRSSLKDLTVECDGKFIFSAAIIVYSPNENKVRVSLTRNKYQLLTARLKDLAENSYSVLNLFESLYLSKGDILSVRIHSESALNVSTGSSISFLLFSDVNNNGHGFAVRLPPEIHDKSPFSLPISNFMQLNGTQPYFLNTSKINLFSIDKLQLRQYGLYIVSLALEVKLAEGDTLEATAVIGGHSEAKSRHKLTDGLSGYSTVIEGTKENTALINLVGTLELRSEDFLSILLLSEKGLPFSISEASILSVTAIRGRSVMGEASFLPASSIMSCSKHWVSLNHWKASNNPQNSLNQFFKGEEVFFQAPSRGVYQVRVQLRIKSITSEMQQVGLAAASKDLHEEPPQVYIFHIVSSNDGNLVSLSAVVELRQEDGLRIAVSCNGSIMIVDGGLQVIFLQKIDSERYTIARNTEPFLINETSSFLTQWNRVEANSVRGKLSALEVLSDGVYLIVVHLQVRYTAVEGAQPSKVQLEISGDSSLSQHHVFEPLKDSNNYYVSLQICDSIRLNSGDKVSIRVYVSHPGFVYFTSSYVALVLLASKPYSTDGFKAIQQSQKLMTFTESWNTVDSLQFIEKEGGFQLPGTDFFAAFYLPSRPITVLCFASIELKDAVGKFEISLRVRSRGHVLSNYVISKTKQSITLSIVGAVHLEVGNDVELTVRGWSSEVLVLSPRSSWSMIGLVQPSEHAYWTLESANSSDRMFEVPHSGSYFVSHKFSEGASGGRVRHSSKLVTLAAGQQVTSKASTVTSFYQLLQSERLDKVNQLIDFDLLQSGIVLKDSIEGASEEHCDIFVLNINLNFNSSVPSTAEILLHRLNGTTVMFRRKISAGVQEICSLFTVCISPSDRVLIQAMTDALPISQLASNDTPVVSIKPGSDITMLKFTDVNTAEGFSSFLPEDVVINCTDRFSRIDGWTTYSLDAGGYFDKGSGFHDGAGVFVARESGNYLIAVSMTVVQTDDAVGCIVAVLAEEETLLHREVRPERTSDVDFAEVFHAERGQFIQLGLVCDKEAFTTILKHSTLSILLIDSRPSLPPCSSFADELQIEPNVTEVVAKDGNPIELACHFGALMGDFRWIRYGETRAIALGQRGSRLRLSPARESDSGVYQCLMRRGDLLLKSSAIKLKVIDPNPHLTLSSSHVQIEENTITRPILAWIKVTAYNIETQRKAKVKLWISTDNQNNNFLVEPNVTMSDATLYLQSALDYELKKIYHLIIRAENMEFDGEAVQLQTFTVSVVNLNDNRPEFINYPDSVSVTEGTRVGSHVVQISARDFDADSFNIVTFSIANSLGQSYFDINRTDGRISIRREIDFETTSHIYILICASDGVYDTYKEMLIEVIDVNDNRPEFLSTKFAVDVLEETPIGTAVLYFYAADRDSGVFGKVDFAILPNEQRLPFLILGNTLTLVERLAVLKESEYLFSVAASDGGNLTSSKNAEVSINIVRGDPGGRIVFPQNSSTILIDENVPRNYTVAEFKAEAKDFNSQSSSGWVKYQILSYDSDETISFSIDMKTGRLFTISELDYEKKKRHLFIVEGCLIKSDTSVCAHAHVTVLLNDQNDNKPTFSSSVYRLKISEDAAVGSHFPSVHAVDPDSGVFGKISYSIQNGGEDVFTIDRDTGDLILIRALDFEDKKQFHIIISGEDGGIPPLSRMCAVQIQVENINEFAPVFMNSTYHFAVSENNELGISVGRVQACDKDKFDELFYFIPEEQVSRTFCFSVDELSGIIRVNCVFDREEAAVHTFAITAKDSKNMSLSGYAVVVVKILDVNDNAPYFKVHEATVAWAHPTAKHGSEVYRIDADDEDDGDNATLKFTFTGDRGIFSIESRKKSGYVYIDGATPGEAGESYMLKVQVTDIGIPPLAGGSEFSLNVILGELNLKDSLRNTLSFSIEENSPIGSYVGILDQSSSSNFNYDVSMPFYINNSVLYTTSVLDFEERQSYLLLINKTLGSQVLRVLTIHVLVLDVDERQLACSKSYKTEVYENSLPGSILQKLPFFYAGYPSKPLLTWQMVSFGPFLLSDDGTLYLTSVLDSELVSQYDIAFEIRDQKDANISAACNATVVILDLNDNQPVFQKSAYSFTTPEDTPAEEAFGFLAAFDQDTSPENRVIEYRIDYWLTPHEMCFAITLRANGSGSDIYLKRSILEYEPMECKFMITARNVAPSGTQVSYVEAQVSITDVNDNPPIFPRLFYEFTSINSAERNDNAIGIIYVEDHDTDYMNRHVRFEIVSPDSSTYKAFYIQEINENTGRLKRNGDLPKGTYTFQMKAIDHGAQPLSTREHADVVVHVLDVVLQLESKAQALTNTSISVTFTVDRESIADAERCQFVAQEYHPENLDFSRVTNQPPVWWYDVYRSKKFSTMRRFIAGELSVREARSARSATKESVTTVLQFDYGADDNCSTSQRGMCNGELMTGHKYRFQLMFAGGNGFLRHTGFTIPYLIGRPVLAKRVSFTWWHVFLLWWFWAILFLFACAIIIIICLGKYCRKYSRSKRELLHTKEELVRLKEWEMKSMMIFSHPAETQEALLSISCETLPAAYISQQDLRKGAIEEIAAALNKRDVTEPLLNGYARPYSCSSSCSNESSKSSSININEAKSGERVDANTMRAPNVGERILESAPWPSVERNHSPILTKANCSIEPTVNGRGPPLSRSSSQESLVQDEEKPLFGEEKNKNVVPSECIPLKADKHGSEKLRLIANGKAW